MESTFSSANASSWPVRYADAVQKKKSLFRLADTEKLENIETSRPPQYMTATVTVPVPVVQVYEYELVMKTSSTSTVQYSTSSKYNSAQTQSN